MAIGPPVERPSAQARWGRLAAALLILIPLGGGFWWWQSVRAEQSRADERLEVMRARRDANVRSVEFRISNVREHQSLTEAPPYHAPGGTWTVLDIAPASAGSAPITIALEWTAQRAAFVPSDRRAAQEFVAALATGLGHTLPPEQHPEPLSVVQFGMQVLGKRLGAPAQGLTPAAGNWAAAEWFIPSEDADANVIFSLDLTAGRAVFSEKATVFSEELLPLIAAAVRDGPRPPRTPENDPTFTTDGPRVVDLKTVPNSTGWVSHFARGGRFLILTASFDSTGAVRLVPLETPDKPIDVGTFDGSVFSAVNEDPDANKLLVFQSPVSLGKGYATKGSYHLWRVDRRTGVRREIKCPHGLVTYIGYPPNRALSSDGRFLVVTCLARKPDSRDPVPSSIEVIDLATEQFTRMQTPRSDLELSCWSQTPDGSARLVLSLEDRLEIDFIPRGRKYVADPTTGVVTDMPSPPLPTPDLFISPDGRLRLTVREREAIDITDLATGQVRTFDFREKDRKFIGDGMFAWLDSRYVKCSTFFIDVIDMKQGNMPMFEEGSRTKGYHFSPDFKWAVSSRGEMFGEIIVGRVVLPHPHAATQPTQKLLR